MPYRSNVPCKHPGCAALIPHVQMYCDEHKQLHKNDRAYASERGYGSKRQRERRRFSDSNPFCVKRYEEGHLTKATVVDHIKPHRGDQKFFWNRGNWQPLCEHHHNVKTMTEDTQCIFLRKTNNTIIVKRSFSQCYRKVPQCCCNAIKFN